LPDTADVANLSRTKTAPVSFMHLSFTIPSSLTNWDSVNPWPYACLGFGIFFLIFSIVIAKKFAESKLWPSTSGNILKSTVETKWDSTAGSNYRLMSKPNVIYEDQVSRKIYQGHTLSLTETSSSNEATARITAAAYIVGQQVTVYYDPRKPESATLAIGDPTHGIFPTVFFAIRVLATIGRAIWLAMSRR
jgi:hypothetical protein